MKNRKIVLLISVCIALAAGTAIAKQQSLYDRLLHVFSWNAPGVLTISSNRNNYNIFLAAGSPTSAMNVTLTINSGVVVGSTSTSVAAIDTGIFPAGSTITIINNGYIIGCGGTGGTGGNGNAGTGGGNGFDGGPAMNLQMNVTITNNGNIWGGGGGGGGGGGS